MIEEEVKNYVTKMLDKQYQVFELELNQYHNLMMKSESTLKDTFDMLESAKKSFEILIKDVEVLKKEIKNLDKKILFLENSHT